MSLSRELASGGRGAACAAGAGRGRIFRRAPEGPADHEDPCQSPRRRRRCRRHLHRLSPGPRGLGRCDALGARRADIRVDLACRGPAALVQHGLCHQPYPRLFRPLLQDAGGGDRVERGLFGRGQSADGADAGPDGRIHALCRDGGKRGHPGGVDDARSDQGALAACADRGSEGGHLSSDRWLHKPRRCDHGHGQGRPPAGRGDRAEMAGRWLCLDRV